MSLGQLLQKAVNNELEINEIKYRSEEQKIVNKADKENKNIEKLINAIKLAVEEISKGNQKVVLDNNKRVKLCDIRNVFNGREPFHLHHNGNNANILDYLNSKGSVIQKSCKALTQEPVSVREMPNKIKEFSQWLHQNEIKNVIVKYDHDGVGMESWNTFWAVV